ncbi:transient receptor potential cation channel subfamily M [Pimephales promelas]|nr:transient receptor potential cation channel subfamily M [Pimephales promelas]
MDELDLAQTLAAYTGQISRNLSLSPFFQRCSLASWIKDNIKKKECYFYEEGASLKLSQNIK